MPYVSVIVPVYNVAPYLRECLDSLVNQTLKEIEIICVDDGSTDNCPEILKEYKSKDKRIQIVTQPNRGVSAARNTGAGYADGEYLYFMDSDDYLELHALEYLYHEAKKQELDILCFDGVSFYETEELAERFKGKSDISRRNSVYDTLYSGEEIYLAMKKNSDYRPMPWLQLIQRTYYKESELSFLEGVVHEDELFGLQATLLAKRASHRNAVLYHYRRRTGTITIGGNSTKRLHGIMEVLIHTVRFMDEQSFQPDVEFYVKRHVEWLYRIVKCEYHALKPENRVLVNEATYAESFTAELILSQVRDNTISDLQAKVKELDKAKNVWETERKKKDEEIAALNATLKNMQDEYVKEKQRAENYKKQLQDMSNSYSFKIGRCLTWFPRKVRDCFRKAGLK